MKRYPDLFSVQGCDASDGMLSGRARHSFLDDPLFGSDLCPTIRRVAASRVARAAIRRDRLSLGHIDTISSSVTRAIPKPLVFRVWKGASLGQTPGIPNHGRSSNSQQKPTGKRGKILRQSESSRGNLKFNLAKIVAGVDLYTMCLSLPGHVDHLTHNSVKMAFLRFLKRLTAKISRDVRFHKVAGLWKQELQKRNALHFHLLFAGVELANLDDVHRWISEQWIECVMLVSGMPSEIVAEETRKMSAVHLHPKNFEKIRGNFHAYFAKYLGKDVDAHAAEFPIPGRWWGKFNSEHIPLGELQELVLPARVALHSQRVCRKIRQARADDAKHRALCRKFDMLKDGQPTVSRFALLECYERLQSAGGMVAMNADGTGTTFRKVLGVGRDPAALAMLLKADADGFPLGDLVKGVRFPAAMKFSSVRLTGSHVPAMMKRILQWSGGRALIDREQTPF